MPYYGPSTVTSITASGQGLTRTTANNAGTSDAATQLSTDLATAIAAGHKRLYLPAGTYKISSTAATAGVLALANDGVEIFGDGIGRTIIEIGSGVTLTNNLYMFYLSGRNQYVHDLSITTHSSLAVNSKEVGGVYLGPGAFDCVVERVEVYNFIGGPASGSTGFGFGTYQPWNQAEWTTTLTASIASSGSQVATPANMRGIYVGQQIKTASEYVTVTAVTPTTFTATFTTTYANGATITIPSYGFSRGTYSDCIVRDSPYTTAFGVNSNGNKYNRCRVSNVGDSTLRHGFYIQGGSNVFAGCSVEGVAGYSYHGWKKVPYIESGGDKFIGCTSKQPRTSTGHMIISGTPSDGTNPTVPNGYNLTRYTEVTGCEFRGDVPAICSFDNPVVFTNNVCENAYVSEQGGSVVNNNLFIRTAFSSLSINYTALTIGSLSNCSNNIIELGSTGGQSGINANGSDINLIGNRVKSLGSFSRGIIIGGSRVRCHDNYIESDSYYALSTGNALSLDIANNTLTATIGAALLLGTTPSGIIRGNTITGGLFRADPATETLRIEQNTGPINANGRTASIMKGTEGIFRTATLTSGTVVNQLLMRWSGGSLIKLSTSDTIFAAVAYSEALNPGEAIMYAADLGAGVDILCDGAWTKGNVGIASTTSAGKIHDSGTTTAPGSGSYVVFLDSGSSGTARCTLVKTV